MFHTLLCRVFHRKSQIFIIHLSKNYPARFYYFFLNDWETFTHLLYILQNFILLPWNLTKLCHNIMCDHSVKFTFHFVYSIHCDKLTITFTIHQISAHNPYTKCSASGISQALPRAPQNHSGANKIHCSCGTPCRRQQSTKLLTSFANVLMYTFQLPANSLIINIMTFFHKY